MAISLFGTDEVNHCCVNNVHVPLNIEYLRQKRCVYAYIHGERVPVLQFKTVYM